MSRNYHYRKFYAPRFPDYVEKSERELSQCKEPEVVKLYCMARPYKGNKSIVVYEMLKKHIAHTQALMKDYTKWITLIIEFLNV